LEKGDILMFFGNNMRSNMNIESRNNEVYYCRSSAEKRADQAAKEAVRKYKEEMGIKDKTIWGSIKRLFVRK
jgi:hypothetical protein